jgi:hypothetical protein
MATITVSATQIALAAENLPLSIPLKTYAVSHDSAERAEPSPPMERSQIRNRGQEGRSSKLVTSNSPNIPDSSPSTPQTLTPESIDHPKQIKGTEQTVVLKYIDDLTEFLQSLAQRLRLF